MMNGGDATGGRRGGAGAGGRGRGSSSSGISGCPFWSILLKPEMAAMIRKMTNPIKLSPEARSCVRMVYDCLGFSSPAMDWRMVVSDWMLRIR